MSERIGGRVEELDTPVLLIDLDIMERNIEAMARYFRGRKAGLRPHAKTHRSPIIAHKQLAAGAIGITCAKLGEAEVLVEGGIRDILIANQMVGPRKIARLVSLARHAAVKVAVDDPVNMEELSEAAIAKEVRLGVLVEVDLGMRRCGVQPGKPVLELARKVAGAPGLEFLGLQGYEGHVINIVPYEERKSKAEAALRLLTDTRRLIEDEGLAVKIVSAGGSATYDITGAWPGVDEVQAGSYVFMDASYSAKEGMGAFDCALTVLATVLSRPTPDHAVTDAGHKVLTTEFGMPQVMGLEGVRIGRLSEEHSRLEIGDPSLELKAGDKVRILPSHCCTTINLFDRYYAVREGRLEAVWPVAARGRSD